MGSLVDIGEKNAIRIVLECLEWMPDMPIPFGDDVSAFRLEGKILAVLKTDMLVGKTDVPPGMSLCQAARKAVVMNISDFAAKGVKPRILVAALGLPGSLSERDIREIGRGLDMGAREYGAYVVGGDTNEASDLIISCALMGVCHEDKLVTRSGARAGDILAVTGYFGNAAAGLRILLNGLHVNENLEKPLLDAVLMPRARLKEGLALAEAGVLTASIDSSDGLVWSLFELSEASKVGFVIEDVPVALEAREFAETCGLNPLELALYGGEEYELVLTIKPEAWETAEMIARDLGTSLMRIGRVIEKPEILLKCGERMESLERRGWEHFRSSHNACVR
ncbi:MAG: thiamine-phosphate kinase [Nitrososphaerota archaeon]|nr:thiamine-phosphate kinase [Candidatus Bathyarchaeota archaeon]MDW8048155.1 thiamine-phosphate kinase [Nitrososphaerota archaeon]